MSKSVAIIGSRGYPSYYGGFETLVRHLSPFLAYRGWDVTVYGRDGPTMAADPLIDRRINSIVTKGIESRSLSTLSYGLTASLHAGRRRPDVALVMNVANGYWLPILNSRGIPTVVNVDGIEWERAKWGPRAKTAFKIGARLTAKYGDQLVYDSREIARRWATDFGREGAYIPYGGTAVGKLAPPAGFTPREYALMVARFVPENTVAEFFQAATRLSTTTDVVIVGSSGYGGPFDAQARALSDSSNRIHWLGHISDDQLLFSLWQHAGVYFHGHSVGGTNPALVQAMACGTPIVARDTAFNREVLNNAGLFVQPDADAIAIALESVVSDSRLQDDLSHKAIKRLNEGYTWESVCAKYEDCLLEQL